MEIASPSIAFALAATLPVCGPALDVAYSEGAPRDRMVLVNRSTEDWAVSRVEIDLGGSAGRLIFDTAAGGPGSSVHQPWRAEAGDARLADLPLVADGARGITLSFEQFATGGRFVFSLDLDDTADPSGFVGTTIAGAEIAGATVRATFVLPDGTAETHDGVFDDRAEARATAPCLS